MSLIVECLSSTEVGPFPSFIERESVIVRGFVASRQPLGGPAISGGLAMRRRTGEPARPSALSSGMVRSLTFSERDQTAAGVPRHLRACNATHKEKLTLAFATYASTF